MPQDPETRKDRRAPNSPIQAMSSFLTELKLLGAVSQDAECSMLEDETIVCKFTVPPAVPRIDISVVASDEETKKLFGEE